MYLCCTTHAGESPQAPPTFSTWAFSSPAPMPDVLAALARCNVGPVIHARKTRLAFPPVGRDPTTALVEVATRYESCARCHLAENRTRIVSFRGNPEAVVCVVSDSPSFEDDTRGLPMAGNVGKLQDELFGEAGIDAGRDLAWIPLVGCRTCDNRSAADRAPTQLERVACAERAVLLLRALRPRIVLCLGTSPAEFFFTSTPQVNSWTPLVSDKHPEDTVLVGVVKSPAQLLRTIGMPNTYKDYAAARLFLRGLRDMLAQAPKKVSAWRFMPQHLLTLAAPLVGP
jgi:uracil-DNA glycosylase family 4